MEAGAGVTSAGRVHTVHVEVVPSYPVLVGHDILAHLADAVDGTQLALVADETVDDLHGGPAAAALASGGRTVHRYRVPPGEDAKRIERYEALQRAFARDGLDRSATVVALGGGVVSDLAGFVAATYLRGVSFVIVSTTLLGMVDASVGGKTAVNLPEGKNLVGAFWQPRVVLADVGTLRTLPEREFRLGAVEAYKHGLLADPTLLDVLDDPEFHPAGDPSALAAIVRRSVQVKADVVAADERESGVRAHLNLGHTLAHALESVTGHDLAHGEAVAYGLLYAAFLGRGRGWADWVPEARRLVAWLEPRALPDVDIAELEPFLRRDKKARAGRSRWVLLREIGDPRVVDDVAPEELRAAWKALRAERT